MQVDVIRVRFGAHSQHNPNIVNVLGREQLRIFLFLIFFRQCATRLTPNFRLFYVLILLG